MHTPHSDDLFLVGICLSPSNCAGVPLCADAVAVATDNVATDAVATFVLLLLQLHVPCIYSLSELLRVHVRLLLLLILRHYIATDLVLDYFSVNLAIRHYLHLYLLLLAGSRQLLLGGGLL